MDSNTVRLAPESETTGYSSPFDYQTSVIIEKRSGSERFLKSVSLISENFGQFAKLAGFLTSIMCALGAVLMIMYLHRSGAPFPLESLTVQSLVLVAAVCFALAIPAVWFLLFPGYLQVANRTRVEKAFPELYATGVSRSFKQYCRAYATYYLPLMLMALGLCCACLFMTASFKVWLLPLLGAPLVGFALLFFLIKRNHSKKLASDLATSSFLAHLYSLAWLLLFTMALLDLLEKAWAPEGTRANAAVGIASVLGAVLGAVLLHFFFSSLANAPQLICVGILIVVCAILFWPGGAVLGGATLRYLRVGGDIPVSLLVKTYEPGSAQTTAKVVSGCLVLSFGNEVLLRSIDFPSECKSLRAVNPFRPQETQRDPKPYEGIRRFARSDVLTFSEFLDPCGTVDGIDGCTPALPRVTPPPDRAKRLR
jgi:hypothetical protein